MSRRTLKTGDEEGFLMACWDDLAETSIMYQVVIEIRLQPSVKRGEWEFVAEAWKRHEERGERPWAEGRYPWPTHAAKTLYAALYRVCVRIGGECASANRRLRGYDSLPPSEEAGE